MTLHHVLPGGSNEDARGVGKVPVKDVQQSGVACRNWACVLGRRLSASHSQRAEGEVAEKKKMWGAQEVGMTHRRFQM